MKTFRKTVEIGLADASKNYDLAALEAAAKSGTKHGHLNVTVERLTREDGSEYFSLLGDALKTDQTDDIDAVNARLLQDLGRIGKVSKADTGLYKAGDPIDLWYVLNHDGLPLAYNAEIRATFAKERSGRVNSEEIALAMQWMMSSEPGLAPLLQAGASGIQQIVSKYRDSRK